MEFKKIFGFLFAIIFAITCINAQDFDKSKLPKLLGASNAGTEFYFTFIPCWETPDGGNQLKIYVSSEVATEVTVTVPGKGYQETKVTIPNDIIEFFLTPDIGQAYRKNDRDVPLKEQVFEGAGIQVTSGAPIVCYGVTRYKYTSDGFLAIPVSSLGTEYIVASYADPSPNTIQFLPSYTGIVSPYDNTKVSFTMGGTETSKTAGGLLPGETSEFNMNKGDVLLFGSLGGHADLSGSKITATNPVSVVSGNFCAYIPTSCGCCDIIMEQEIPTFSWGTEYHITRIVNRLKNSIIKVFAKEDSTKIYRDFLEIGKIKTSGGTEGEGHLHLRAAEGDPRPIVISGDKPINVTQFNTGQMDDNVPSDPFQMVLMPIEQYRKDITFNTPGIRGGFGFPMNYINICYESDESGRIPDDFIFGQVKDGQIQWKLLKEFSPDIGQPFAHQDGGKYYFSKTILLPEDGVYKLKCITPFAAYGFGFSSYDSYGFPTAGSYIEEIEDKLPPRPVVTENNDGTVKGMVSSDILGDTPANLFGPEFYSNSTLSVIMMYEPESFNYNLTYTPFIAGRDHDSQWELNVKDKSKEARAIMVFSDRSGNDTVLVFSYKPLGVEEMNNNNNIVLYPQPVKDELTIIYSKTNSGNISFNLFDLNGRLIKEMANNVEYSNGANSYKFDLPDIVSGVYNLQIIDGNSILTRKIIIKR